MELSPITMEDKMLERLYEIDATDCIVNSMTRLLVMAEHGNPLISIETEGELDALILRIDGFKNGFSSN